MKLLSVYKCGTEVVLIIGKFTGMITAAVVRFEKIEYEVTYDANGERKSIWVNEAEFTTSSEKIEIGFKRSKTLK